MRRYFFLPQAFPQHFHRSALLPPPFSYSSTTVPPETCLIGKMSAGEKHSINVVNKTYGIQDQLFQCIYHTCSHHYNDENAINHTGLVSSMFFFFFFLTILLSFAFLFTFFFVSDHSPMEMKIKKFYVLLFLYALLLF